MRRSACSSATGNEFIRDSEVSQLPCTRVHPKPRITATSTAPADSSDRRRTGTRARVQMVATVRPSVMSTIATSTVSRRIRPCWNSATIAVGVNCAACSQIPPCTAATKAITQVPTVTASVRIAEVEG